MLEALLIPESVAVIGASRSPGKVGHEILANLVAGGFAGRLVPVNRSAGEVLGRRCFPDLKTYGGKIDLSIIAVPAAAVQAAVRDWAAETAASQKPVVVLKAGVTAAGSLAASSHTGSLAGAGIAYGAAFKRSGIVRADTFEALFDYATAFAMQPLPRGSRVAIITNAGGPGIMAADAVEQSGMKVQPLAGSTATALRKKLPAAASVGNPIDVLGDADPDRYVTAVEAARDDDSIDAIIVILTPQAMTKPAETARAITRCPDGLCVLNAAETQDARRIGPAKSP